MGFVSEEARDSSHIMSAAVRGGPETPQIWLTFVTCSLYHFCILLIFSRFPYSTWNKDNALSLYTYNDAAAMSIVSKKKPSKSVFQFQWLKWRVSCPWPLILFRLPAGRWIRKDGMSLSYRLWVVFGCLLVVFWLSLPHTDCGLSSSLWIVGCVSTGWWLPASAPPRLRAWARGSAQPKPNPSPSLNPQSAKPQKQKQRNRVASSQVQQNDPVLRGLKENRPIIFSPSPPKLFYFFSELGSLPGSIF